MSEVLCLPLVVAHWLLQLERQILARKIEREEELAALRATSPEALQEGIVAKMRHLTKGDERTCRRLLELHNYDLKSAVDAYY